MKINLRCACGSSQFVLADADDETQPPRPGGRIRCAVCSALVTLPKLDSQELADAAQKGLADLLGKGLKKR